MNEEKGQKEFSPSLLRLFLEDLKAQVRIFEKILSDVDQEYFLLLHQTQLEKILHSLIGSTKIVKLKVVELLLQSFENYIIFLSKKAASLSTQEKELIRKGIYLLEEMSRASENDLLSYIAQKGGEYQTFIENLEIKKGPETQSIEDSTLKKYTKFDSKMLNLFKGEIEDQIKILTEGLLTYQRSKDNLKLLEPLMRAAHSIKGAAKVFSFDPIVQLTHAIEDCFVAAEKGRVVLDDDRLEVLFKSLDLLALLVSLPTDAIVPKLLEIQSNLTLLKDSIKQFNAESTTKAEIKPLSSQLLTLEPSKEISYGPSERILRMTAQNLNRLMGLAAESMVETRWLRPFCDSLLRFKQAYNKMFTQLDGIKNSLENHLREDVAQSHLISLEHILHESQNELSERVADLEMFITRHSNLTDRLYTEVIESRMRPFADAVNIFPRMVWETARQLKKKARLEIYGKSILIDREILEKLEIPLGHLLRNAIDHGIGYPDERVTVGKLPEGVIKLEASQQAGMLKIQVIDDGKGINTIALRKKIVEEKLITEENASKISEQELLQFLFLPGISTASEVTELSGRGIGLNIVQNMLQEISGSIHIENRPGQGVSFILQLPLTLSVIRALIIRVDQCVFAFPLARIEQAVHVARHEIEKVENREYFMYLGSNVGLIPAFQLLNLKQSAITSSIIPVVILRYQSDYYGIVVDEFLNEKELVLQDIESHMGKIPCISAGSVMENGDPVLIVDVEDILEVINKQLGSGQLYKLQYDEEPPKSIRKKRVLIVDDSISVREVECRLLRNRGYMVDTAVNGVDAWNAVRLEPYDLVVTDVDMPRMNGIDLIRAIKKDARLKNTPVMIVSYKEGESDRILGLEAGANYYLSKSTFGDEMLIQAVEDLIGGP